MPAGLTHTDSMFSVREVPWHGLGAVLDTPPATSLRRSSAQVSAGRSSASRSLLTAARSRLVTGRSRCEEIAGYYATVRQDTREVLGIVGERYRIVQNEEAFQFVDQLSAPRCTSRPPVPVRRPQDLGARTATRAHRDRR